jgi:copper chaperone CopZ
MTKKILLKIEGMHCPNCPMLLERIEDKMPGIERAEASYHKAQMVVEFDETRVTEEQISAEVVKMGYEITAVTPQ